MIIINDSMLSYYVIYLIFVLKIHAANIEGNFKNRNLLKYCGMCYPLDYSISELHSCQFIELFESLPAVGFARCNSGGGEPPGWH